MEKLKKLQIIYRKRWKKNRDRNWTSAAVSWDTCYKLQGGRKKCYGGYFENPIKFTIPAMKRLWIQRLTVPIILIVFHAVKGLLTLLIFADKNCSFLFRTKASFWDGHQEASLFNISALVGSKTVHWCTYRSDCWAHW